MKVCGVSSSDGFGYDTICTDDWIVKIGGSYLAAQNLNIYAKPTYELRGKGIITNEADEAVQLSHEEAERMADKYGGKAYRICYKR